MRIELSCSHHAVRLLGRLVPAKILLTLAVALAAAVPAPVSANEGGSWLDQTFASKTSSSTYSNQSSQGSSRASRKSQTSVASNSSDEKPRRSARRSSGSSKVASLSNNDYQAPRVRSSGGGSINWVASSGCLSSSLRSVISHVASNYGSVTVSSTCRSHAHNARVGGAPKSYHLTGSAADFRVHGNSSGAMAYLRGAVGGFKHYGGGLFHIDTGPRRPM